MSERNQPAKQGHNGQRAQQARTTGETPHNDISPKVGLPDFRTLSPQNVLRLQRTHGNQFVQNLLQRTTGRAKPLTVNAPNDRYEQEADQAAQQVMQQLRPQSPTTGLTANSHIQLSAADSTHDSTPVTPEIEAQIEAQRGGGEALDSSVRAPMEQVFGVNFGRMRIHQGAAADMLSRKLSAQAFATDSDIFFRNGLYRPAQAAGQRLLAHELAHVAQQRSGQVQRSIIQRALDTAGGSWDAPSYTLYQDGGKYGAEITLEFTPNKLVESKKIGLVQKVKKIANGVNLDLEKVNRVNNGGNLQGQEQTAYNRTTDTGEGHWDRALSSSNPVYGAPELQTGQDISETPESTMDMSAKAQQKGTASNYQLGYRYNGWFGRNKVRAAKLYDKPNFDATPLSEMIFETAAMSIDGPQKGTYYGSVEWGFRLTGQPNAPQHVLVPLSVVSMGVPSDNMLELAEIWNNYPTMRQGAPVTNTQMPVSNPLHIMDNVDLNDATSIQTAMTQLNTAATTATGNDVKNIEFALKFLKTKLKNLGG